MRKIFIILIVGLTLFSCGTIRPSTNNLDVVITEDGIVGIGEATAQNERTANSIAVRLARAHLIHGINSVLADIDESIGLKTGTHSENIIQDSKIVNTSLSTKGGSYSVTAVVELSNSAISKWAEGYYDKLFDDDPIHRMTKEAFINLIYQILNNKQ